MKTILAAVAALFLFGNVDIASAQDVGAAPRCTETITDVRSSLPPDLLARETVIEGEAVKVYVRKLVNHLNPNMTAEQVAYIEELLARVKKLYIYEVNAGTVGVISVDATGCVVTLDSITRDAHEAASR